MVLMANNLEVDVRAGTVADVPVLLEFFGSMAAFEKLTVSATEESLRAALFGENPAARTLLAYVDGKPIAYAIYFFTFSTMVGKRGLWLEDLFIDAAFRGKGIGKALMTYLAGIAVQNDCGRFEWIVLDWNASAIRFYTRLGATLLADWRICRLDEAQLSRLRSAEGEPSVPPPEGGSHSSG
jgi:GNAT superfamily N-acetyltransferase